MPDSPCTDPIVEAVVGRLRDRSRVGEAKYGTTLAASSESLPARLCHAQEEAMDLANYLEWAAQAVKGAAHILHALLPWLESPAVRRALAGDFQLDAERVAHAQDVRAALAILSPQPATTDA